MRVVWWLALAAGVGLFVGLLLRGGGDGEREAAAVLAPFVGEARWSPGRSALELPYRPYQQGATIEKPAAALAALHEGPLGGAAPIRLALAQLYLGRGEVGDLERAEAHLDRAGEAASVWNERALLRLADGARLDALDAVLQALERDPGLPAACFNHGLLLEELGLFSGAADAWRRFLEVEATGPWAEEARARQEALASRFTRPHGGDEDFQLLTQHFLALRSRADLDRLLASPSFQAMLDRQASLGDGVWHAQIAHLQRPDADWAAHTRDSIEYPAHRQAVFAGTMGGAKLDQLRRMRAPLFAVRYTHLAAYDALQRHDPARALQLLSDLEALCARHGCSEEVILVQSDMGNVLLYSNDFQGAEAAYWSALQRLPEGNLLRRAELYTKLSSLWIRTGRYERGTKHALRAAQLAREAGSDVALSAALLNAGVGARNRGMPGVAGAFASEARVAADRAGLARIEIRASGLLTDVALEQGAWERAEAEATATLAAAERLGMSELVAAQRRKLAEVLLARGELDRALELAAAALELVQREQLVRLLPSAWELVGQIQLRRGRAAEAQRALEEALAHTRAVQASAPDVLARQRMEAASAQARLGLARLQSDRGAPEAAWQTLADVERRPLAPDECLIAAGRPQDEGVSLRWVATAAGTRFVPGREDRLASELAEACGAGIRRVTLLDRPGLEAPRLARALRRAAPAWALVLASSPALPWPDRPAAGPALAVHSPRDIPSERGLAWLAHAPREARVAVERFAGSRELRDEAATPGELQRLVDRYGVLHFAVHGETQAARGASSYLLLGGSAGRLQVADILRLPLQKRAPLVVLTACKSGGEVSNGEEDGAGLPWAFLRAGARAVIAYQDGIEDEVALEFSAVFYEALGEGAGLSDAFELAVKEVRTHRGVEAAAAFLFQI